jgi:hypothetical protein
MCTLMYIMYICWFIVYNCNTQTCTYGGSEWCKNNCWQNPIYVYIDRYVFFFLKISWGMYICHNTIWKRFDLWLHNLKRKEVVWWCGILVHAISTWDLIIYMLNFLNYKLFNATCDCPKRLKIISLKMF